MKFASMIRLTLLLFAAIIFAGAGKSGFADEDTDMLLKANGYFDEGKYDEAIREYTALLDKNPTYAVAFHSRGFAYSQKGDLDNAIADYTKALEINSNLSDVYIHRAMVYFVKGDYEKSLSDVDGAQKAGLKDYFDFNDRIAKLPAAPKLPCAKLQITRQEYDNFVSELKKASGRDK